MVISGDGAGASDTVSVKSQPGFVAMGTGGFYYAEFDNFSITKGIIIHACTITIVTYSGTLLTTT